MSAEPENQFLAHLQAIEAKRAQAAKERLEAEEEAQRARAAHSAAILACLETVIAPLLEEAMQALVHVGQDVTLGNGHTPDGGAPRRSLEIATGESRPAKLTFTANVQYAVPAITWQIQLPHSKQENGTVDPGGAAVAVPRIIRGFLTDALPV